MVTIFSAPGYMGDFDNEGAMMDVDETLMCKFVRIKCEPKKAGAALQRKGTGFGAVTFGGGRGTRAAGTYKNGTGAYNY